MFRVDISETAKRDMRFNAAWWKENRSDEQAGQWLTAIATAIESLSEMPIRCPMAAESIKPEVPI